MKMHVDPAADVLHLRLDDSEVVDSEEVAPGIIVDYNEADDVTGVEIMWLSKRSPGGNFASLKFDYLTGDDGDLETVTITPPK